MIPNEKYNIITVNRYDNNLDGKFFVSVKMRNSVTPMIVGLIYLIEPDRPDKSISLFPKSRFLHLNL